MLQDLAALTPPLIMCVAFLLGVGWFLRHEMAPRRRKGPEEADSVALAGGNADAGDSDRTQSAGTADAEGIPASGEDAPADAGRR